MRNSNGRATFFMLGQSEDDMTGVDHTDIVRDMYKRGFEGKSFLGPITVDRCKQKVMR